MKEKMGTHANRTARDSSTAAAHDVSQTQGSGKTALRFTDNRREAAATRQLQRMANDSPRARQASQWQAMAGLHAARQALPIQNKENHTKTPDGSTAGIESLSSHSMSDEMAHHPIASSAVQRVIKNSKNDKVLCPTKSAAWSSMNEEEQTKARRMINDPYRLYYFIDSPHFCDHVKGKKDPDKTEATWHKQGGKADKQPFGVADPFYEHHDNNGVGGLNIADKPFSGFGKKSLSFDGTGSHKSNWASFVEMHYDGAMKKLMDASKWNGQVQADMEEAYKKALEHADIMDHQFVQEDTKMSLSNLKNVWAGVAVENSVNKMWDLVAQETSQSRHTFANALLPRWGGLHMGMGTSVTATFHGNRNQSLVAGSAADKDLFKPPWLEKLDHRIASGNKAYYIEGHLLNDNLGGPAAPYNIVPLTSDANAVHLHLVETFVKAKVLEMIWEQRSSSKGFSPIQNPIKYIEYAVNADFSGHARRDSTDYWIDAFNLLNDTIDILPKISKKYGNKTKVSEFRQELEYGTFMPHQVEGKALNTAEAWRFLQAAVNFSIPVPADRKTVSLEELLRRFDSVSDLFIAEEKYTPRALTCSSRTVREDNSSDADGQMDERVTNDIGKLSAVSGYK